MSSAFRRAWDNRPNLAVELENKGSVARDHLASERTFLAWMRTSLSLVSLGIAIAQLFKLPELIDPGEPGDQNDFKTYEESFGQQQHFVPSQFVRLESLEKLGKPLGALCIAFGAVCLAIGSFRYFTVQRHLMQGVFNPSRVEISLMTLFIGSFVVASFGIIVGVRLS